MTLIAWALAALTLGASTVPSQPQPASDRLFSCSLRMMDWQNPSLPLSGEIVAVAVFVDHDLPRYGQILGNLKGVPTVSPEKLRIHDPSHLLLADTVVSTQIGYEGADEKLFSLFTDSATGPKNWLRISGLPAESGATLATDLIILRKNVSPIKAALSKMAGTCTLETGTAARTKFEALK